MKSIAILFLAFFSGISIADETVYDLDRVSTWVDGGNVEGMTYEGSAIITDSGPYTEIEHVFIDAESCNGLFFSPSPNCEPIILYVNQYTNGYRNGGKEYVLEDGSLVTFIRRGSVETGDASLILFMDASVIIFKQAEDNQGS